MAGDVDIALTSWKLSFWPTERQALCGLNVSGTLAVRLDHGHGVQEISSLDFCNSPHAFSDLDELQVAVDTWVANRTKAEATYGPMALWDTGNVTSFASLFQGVSSFNEDITNWDTSRATNLNVRTGPGLPTWRHGLPWQDKNLRITARSLCRNILRASCLHGHGGRPRAERSC